MLAYTDDVARFGGYKRYCSYFGVTPRLDESGELFNEDLVCRVVKGKEVA